MVPNLGRFVETRWKLPGTHIEKGLLLSRCLTASVAHHCAVFCSGYLASWLAPLDGVACSKTPTQAPAAHYAWI